MNWAKRKNNSPPEEVEDIEVADAFPKSIQIPVPSRKSVAWSNEGYIALTNDKGVEVIHIDGHIINRKAGVHRAEIPRRLKQEEKEFEEFNELLYQVHRHLLFKASQVSTPSSWTSRVLHSSTFFFHQTDPLKILKLERLKELNANHIGQTLSGELPENVKFWPDAAFIPPPTGGSFLAVQTRNHRLFIYQYCQANPPYWDVLLEVSDEIRKHKITNFEAIFPDIHKLAEELSSWHDSNAEQRGREFYDFVESLNLVDFSFAGFNGRTITMSLLYLDGSVYRVELDLSTSMVVVQSFTKLTPAAAPKGIERICSYPEELYLVWFTDGTYQILYIEDTNITTGKQVKFSDMPVQCIESSVSCGEITIFGGRMSSVEKFVLVYTGDGPDIQSGSYANVQTSNILPFMKITATFISGSVRCTAVSQGGNLYVLELTGQGVLRKLGLPRQIAKLHDSRVAALAISPHSTTTCVVFNKEAIAHKVCDSPVSAVRFFPLLQEAEYEQAMVSIITNHDFDEALLPCLSDFLIPMTTINSDYIQVQSILQSDIIGPSVKFFLTRTLFPKLREKLSDLVGDLAQQSLKKFIEAGGEPKAGSYAAGEPCSVSLDPLDMLCVFCSCCSAGYNLGMSDESGSIRLLRSSGCSFCKMPKPSLRNFDELMDVARGHLMHTQS